MNERIKLASNKNQDEDLKFKMILIGDNNVGKSSILCRFVEDEFVSGVSPSMNKLDYKEKDIQVDGTDVRLTLWYGVGFKLDSYFFLVFVLFGLSNYLGILLDKKDLGILHLVISEGPMVF